MAGGWVPPSRVRLANNIEIRPIGIAGDIFVSVFGNDQNIMFTIAAGARLTIRNGQHRFHRNHHTGFKNGVDIFAQFWPMTSPKPTIAAVVKNVLISARQRLFPRPTGLMRGAVFPTLPSNIKASFRVLFVRRSATGFLVVMIVWRFAPGTNMHSVPLN